MMRALMAYGSEEHRTFWLRNDQAVTRLVGLLSPVVQELFRRQKLSVLDRLSGRFSTARRADAAENPFDKATWIRRFRDTVRVVLIEIVRVGGEDALKELGFSIVFNITNPLVQEFILARAQRFAELVNETTWDMLRKTLAEAISKGEGIPQMMERVKAVMEDRIRSTPETIARTEVISSYNGGKLKAWKQSGQVDRKEWISTLDDRTRTPDNGDEFDHLGAHGEVVGIDEPFTKTGEDLDFPGADGGSAGNVISLPLHHARAAEAEGLGGYDD